MSFQTSRVANVWSRIKEKIVIFATETQLLKLELLLQSPITRRKHIFIFIKKWSFPILYYSISLELFDKLIELLEYILLEGRLPLQRGERL